MEVKNKGDEIMAIKRIFDFDEYTGKLVLIGTEQIQVHEDLNKEHIEENADK